MTDESTAPAFLDGRPRFRTIPLEWPLNFGGKEYREIQVSRLTAQDVAAFQDSLKALPDGAKVVWPVFRDADGAPLPAGLLDALDADDSLELDKAALDFLPRQFRANRTSDSAPASGEATGSTSAT
jgi:hypothetical protein